MQIGSHILAETGISAEDGCINLPPDKAGELYNIIQYDVPIICFY